MFNQSNMKNLHIKTSRRLSSAKSVGFRAGPELRRELVALARTLSRPGSQVTISDILREGVAAFWPQIRLYVRAQSNASQVPPRAFATIVAAGARAHRHGLTAAEIRVALSEAWQAKRRLKPAAQAT